MSAPDFTRGYLRIPHDVWQRVYCRGALTRRQLQLVSVVIRESWGWHTSGGRPYLWTRPLTHRQLADAAGLTTDHLARDLRTLIATGVLKRDGQRYQFVADPALWITQGRTARKQRPSAHKQRSANAILALAQPDVKKAKTSNRNGPAPTESTPSPAVDKSGVGDERSGALAERLVAIVASFVGPLPPHDAAGLRHWVDRTGIAAVWRALAPVLRLPRAQARAALQAILRAYHRDPRA